MICEPVNSSNEVAVKQCSFCRETKSVSDFRARPERKSGLQSKCRACEKQVRLSKPPKVHSSYPEFKTCNKCLESLPASFFSKKSDSSDGLGYSCRGCEKKRNQRRAATPKNETIEKICSVCKKLKLSSMFAKHKYSPDGRMSICKECDSDYHKKISLEKKIIPEFKKCPKCKITKNFEDFGTCSTRRDGLQYSCRECSNAAVREFRSKNPEIVAARSRAYRKNYPDKHCAQVSKRRAKKMQATPPWVDSIHRQQIGWFYAASAMMTKTSGILHHVDHIHPLRGKNFSGLHVVWNLRIIPSKDNSLKSNSPPKEEADMFWGHTMKKSEI